MRAYRMDFNWAHGILAGLGGLGWMFRLEMAFIVLRALKIGQLCECLFAIIHTRAENAHIFFGASMLECLVYFMSKKSFR